MLMILVSLRCAIFGYEVHALFTGEYVSTVYGIDAFLLTFILLVYTFELMFPIIVSYQIIYVIIKIIKKRKAKI